MLLQKQSTTTSLLVAKLPLELVPVLLSNITGHLSPYPSADTAYRVTLPSCFKVQPRSPRLYLNISA